MTNQLIPRLRFKQFNNQWKQIKLGKIVKWSRGKKLLKPMINQSHIGNPVIHYGDLFKLGAIQNNVIHWSTSNEGTTIPINSLLFPASDVTPYGLATTTAILSKNIKAGRNISIGTLINNDYDVKFLSYEINSNPKRILRLVTGTTVTQIYPSELSTININIPNILSEQQKISNLFIVLDKIINLQSSKVANLQQLKKGYLQKMFPQKDNNVPILRFNGFHDAWNKDKLTNLVSIKTGNKNAEDNVKNGKYAFFDRSTQLKYLNTYDYNEKVIVYAGEGAKFLPKYFNGKYSLHQRAYGLYNFNNINPIYLYYFLNIKNNVFVRFSVGTTAKSLRKDTFKHISVNIPSIQEQNKIGQFFKNFDQSIAQQNNKLFQLKRLKKAYLQKMLI